LERPINTAVPREIHLCRCDSLFPYGHFDVTDRNNHDVSAITKRNSVDTTSVYNQGGGGHMVFHPRSTIEYGTATKATFTATLVQFLWMPMQTEQRLSIEVEGCLPRQ
jgi:hypothetical protein